MTGTLRCLLLAALLFAGCRTARPSPAPTTNQPAAEREFRAAWVATVANINWPSRPGLPVDSQQLEAVRLLDFLKNHHFNAVIFQVRPQADALYKSSLEPWSYFLTGTQGKAPDPWYDPLQFWVEAAHERGLELHVWLNPYRVHHPSGGPLSDSSLARKHPELVLPLKTEGYWWFDPTLEGTKRHSTAVVMDLVKRYDIDGVHFDDYFYPYREYNKGEDFPDSASWAEYQKRGGTLSRGDWRRAAVNDFISNLYREIKREKPGVKFGLSPFGIYRPGQPEGACCFDQYDVLYADAKRWLNEGWIDYFSPQLYWPISRLAQSFPVLLGWWQGENTKGRHLWPGISVGADTSVRGVTETVSQIMVSRGMLQWGRGVIHWSIGQVMRSPGLQKALLEGPYRRPALPPPSPWLDAVAPPPPRATGARKGDSLELRWTGGGKERAFKHVVYYRMGKEWNYRILPHHVSAYTLPLSEVRNSASVPLEEVRVTAVDRLGNESAPQAVPVPAPTIAILPRSAWNAAPPAAYKRHVPVRITIHHEGTRMAPGDDPARKIRAIQSWGMGPDRKWADVPYHFFIAPDGRVFEGRDVYTAGETGTEYDPAGHLLISCLGNLEEGEVPPLQLEALVRLIAEVSSRYGLPTDSLATHRDYSATTTCPGKNLYALFKNGYISRRVKELASR